MTCVPANVRCVLPSILVGGQPCEVRSAFEHTVSYIIPNISAGIHSLSMHVRGKGYAIVAPSVIVEPDIWGVQSSSISSLGGGSAILISGRGFRPNRTT